MLVRLGASNSLTTYTLRTLFAIIQVLCVIHIPALAVGIRKGLASYIRTYKIHEYENI